MTLSEWLDHFEKNVAPKYTWCKVHGFMIRTPLRPEQEGVTVYCCPLTAERQNTASYYAGEGLRYGLSREDVCTILVAADCSPSLMTYPYPVREIRDRLLKATKLD